MEFFHPLKSYCNESFTNLESLLTTYKSNTNFIGFCPDDPKSWFPNFIEFLFAKNKILIIVENDCRKFLSISRKITFFKLRPFLVNLHGNKKLVTPTFAINILTQKVLSGFEIIVVDVNKCNENLVINYLHENCKSTTLFYPGELFIDLSKFINQ